MRNTIATTRMTLIALVTVFTLSGCGLFEYFSPKDPGPRPVTLDVLALMPPSAGIALGIPPINAGSAKTMDVVMQFLPQKWEADTVVSDFIGYLGSLAGVEDAQRLGDFFEAAGIDPDTPFGLYIEPLKEAKKTDAPATDKEATQTPSVSLPAIAVAFTYTEPDRIHNFVQTLYGLTPDALGLEAVEEEHANVVIRTLHKDYGAYFIADDQVVISTTATFAKSIADRLQNPADIRYGTAKCRAGSTDELVAVVRMDRMASTLNRVVTFVAGAFPALEMLGPQLRLPTDMFDKDPIIVSFDFDGDKLELVARLDLKHHKKIRTLLGRPKPLRLAAAAPSSTQGLISFRFNDASKEFMLDSFGTLFSGLSDDAPIEFQVGASLGGFVQFVDDEITLALTGVKDGRPTGVGMLAVNNRNRMSNFLLNMPTPGERVDSYKRAEIKTMPPTDLYYAIARNTLVVGNYIDEVKECVMHLMDNKSSGAFEAFTPHIEADIPRYAGMFLMPDGIPEAADTFLPLSDFQKSFISGASGLLRDIRISSDLRGTWLESRFAVRWRERPLPVTVAAQAPENAK